MALALGVVVARSERGVVALSHALAYSTGVSLSLVAYARGLAGNDAQFLFHQQHVDEAGTDELPDGFLRLGLELAGGARLSNLGARRAHRLAFDPDAAPEGPLFFPHGGGGGTGGSDRAILRRDYWLWPLPPPGPIRVACEWPLVGIPLASAEIDGARLVEAAAGVVTLWPDPQP